MGQNRLFTEKVQGVALADVYRKFVEIYLPSKYGSPITRRGYTYDVQEWLDQAQITYVSDLDLEVVQSYLTTGKNLRLKESTRQRKVAALKAFFTYLEQTLQLLPEDFSAAMIWPKVEKDDPRYLTPEQYQAILREAGHHARDLAMLEVLLQTGIRLSELTGLKLDDVDLPVKPSPDLSTGYGIIRIKRKGGKVKEYRP